MSCFVVPMLQALATTAYRKHIEKKYPDGNMPAWKSRIPTLEKFLWGGTIMLIVDHVANGELTWQFPFFTALGQTGGAEVMLHEMLTVGVPMSLVITAVWAVYTSISLISTSLPLKRKVR